MRLNTIFGAAVLAGLCGASLASTAKAADLGPLYAPGADYGESEQPMEFGSGWYLRGDASLSDEDRPKLSLSGLGASFDRNATQLGYAFGGGAGYKFNSFLRADLTADYLDPFEYKANLPCGSSCDINLQTRVSRWDGLVNGYVDLGTWFGVTPYIGAGAGIAGTSLKSSVEVSGGPLPSIILDPTTGTVVNRTVPNRTGYQFAWAAMAGFSYAFSPHVLVDVGYRYLDLGKRTVPLYPVTSVTKNFTAQQVRLGLRYVID